MSASQGKDAHPLHIYCASRVKYVLRPQIGTADHTATREKFQAKRRTLRFLLLKVA